MEQQYDCPLCDSTKVMSSVYDLVADRLDSETRGSVAFHVVCPTCGTFRIGSLLLDVITQQGHWKQTRADLSRAARWASDNGTPLLLLELTHVAEAIKRFQVSNQDREFRQRQRVTGGGAS